MKTEEEDKVEKVVLDITIYQETFKDLVVSSQVSLEEAESLKAQVRAAKAQVKAATDLEWQRKKRAYEEYRSETDKKKAEYYDIRDRRNKLMGACADIYSGIKVKIDNFNAELRRKAEEERKAKGEEEKKKGNSGVQTVPDNRSPKKVVDGKCRICNGTGEIMESEDEQAEAISCPACNAQSVSPQNRTESKSPQKPIETTATPKPSPPQKPEEGQNEAVPGEIEIEVYDMKKMIGAIIQGERGATWDIIKPNIEAIREIAKKFKCQPGNEIITGCRVSNNA